MNTVYLVYAFDPMDGSWGADYVYCVCDSYPIANRIAKIVTNGRVVEMKIRNY